MRILALLSRVLGNRTLSDRLLEAMTSIPGVDVFAVGFDAADYRRFPAPRLIRQSGPLEAQWVFRSKLRSLAIPAHDVVVANGYGLLMAAGNVIRGTPSALATDTTPALQFKQKGLPERRLRRAMVKGRARMAERSFLRMTRHVSAFLPVSQWCAESLANDYKLGRPMFVTSCPQTEILKTLPERVGRDRFQLVFVGNDFVRKGGELLLSLYRGRVRERCDLQIVSNDPILKSKDLPPGITLISGLRDLAQILPIYRSADLLILPTLQDQYSYVTCEGFSQGLPSIASAVGGIQELITESGAGVVLPKDSEAESWANAILRFVENPAALSAARQNALRFAQQRLTMDRFRETIQSLLQELDPVN
jgi:glycosyltransferase involved in cell wall biosynthesis